MSNGLFSIALGWAPDDGRLEARFKSCYRISQIAKSGVRSNPTASELEEFSKEQPEAAHQLGRLQTQGLLCQTTGVVGTVASVIGIYRVTKAPPMLLLGGVLGGITASLLMQDATSWVLGTYTFDNLTPTELYCDWKQAREVPS